MKEEPDTGDMAKLCHEQHESGVENIAGCQMIPLLIYSNLKNGASESYSTASTSKAVFCFSLCLVSSLRGRCVFVCVYVLCMYTCVRDIITIEEQNAISVGDLS